MRKLTAMFLITLCLAAWLEVFGVLPV